MNERHPPRSNPRRSLSLEGPRLASRALLHPGTLAVPGTGLADRRTDRLTDYLVEYVRGSAAPASPAAWEERLTGLGFMAPPPEGRRVCSIVGLVLVCSSGAADKSSS